jgi:hypothetical protein
MTYQASRLLTISGLLTSLLSTPALAQSRPQAVSGGADSLSELYLNVLSRYLVDAGPETRGGFANTVTSTYVGYPEQQTQTGLVALSADLGAPWAKNWRRSPI